ncbi:MAG: hypothetical protein L3J36_10555 [Rhodobacteraceae bacterium]|nr:hypothetical protein [Paracoccaceae bacterium]
MKSLLIDDLQYARFSPAIFEQMRSGGVDSVHVMSIPEQKGAISRRNTGPFGLILASPLERAAFQIAGAIQGRRQSYINCATTGLRSPPPGRQT